MALYRQLSVATLSFLAALSFTMLATPAHSRDTKNGARQKALVLHQVTSTHGLVSTFITDKAIKVVFCDISGYLLAAAPTWRVVLVNVDAKVAYESGFEDWLRHDIKRSYLGAVSGVEGSHPHLLRLGKAKYAGKDCVLYCEPAGSRQRTDAVHRKSDFFVMESALFPKQGCFILQKWFAVPTIQGVPVAFKYANPVTGESLHSSNYRKKLTFSLMADDVDPLDCRKIDDTECACDFFEYPHNLKRVPSEAEIFGTRKKQKEMDDILKDMEQ